MKDMNTSMGQKYKNRGEGQEATNDITYDRFLWTI